MPSVSSDPHAWLRPFYATLQQHPAFRQLAPSHQFQQLCEAIEGEYPSQAAKMRHWSTGAQDGLLLYLASQVNQRTGAKPTELWRVRKHARELRCVVVYLPSGIDLRLMEGDDFRRTELLRDGPSVQTRADAWLQALETKEWGRI